MIFSMKIPKYVQTVLNLLENHGYEAWVVGGCVRDAMLGIEPHDYDVCTSAMPDETKLALQRFSLVEIGIAHGTVGVVTEEGTVEVTTYRSDSDYQDARHPSHVEFLKDIRKDLMRRDFTVNAMAYHPQRGLFDPFQGEEDLKQGLLRCVGKAKKRFSEDALRLLRALRFSSQLDFQLEEKTAMALRMDKYRLTSVSAERITQELSKLLCGKGVQQVLNEWWRVIGVVIPEIRPCVGFRQYSRYHHLDVWHHITMSVGCSVPVLEIRLALLLHDIGKPRCFRLDENGVGHFYGHPKESVRLAQQIFKRLRFSREIEEKVLILVQLHDFPIACTDRALRRFFMKYGEALFFSLLEIKRCDAKAHAPQVVEERLRELDRLEQLAKNVLAAQPCFTLKNLSISGKDLLEAGYSEGPKIGEILQRLLEQVVDGNVKNDRKALLQALDCLDGKTKNSYN